MFLKTESIWGKPNRSFYNFLRLIKNTELPKTFCVLGCSDGKFVLPAARKGFEVLAIDIDKISLYGGNINLFGESVQNIGMERRLEIEGLKERVKIVNGSFLEYDPKDGYSGVFTSGSIHYAENSHIPLDVVINKMKSFVSRSGLLFQEYIHTSESDNDPNRHFLDKEKMETFFVEPEWSIIKHRKKRYTESPNPRVNYEHTIVWGSMIARINNDT